MPAVVTIEVAGERATGFVRDGRVVTVAHVLVAGAAVRVRAGGDVRAATVERTDRATDLAVLRAPGLDPLPAAPVGGVRVLVRRDGGVAALPVTVRRRIVASLRGPGGPGGPRRNALELEGDIRPGDSGAPVVAPGGRLLGVVFARSAGRPRTAYAVAAPR
jgi:S1-C subfamily serine protease